MSKFDFDFEVASPIFPVLKTALCEYALQDRLYNSKSLGHTSGHTTILLESEEIDNENG
ncbi:hypothetical protein [Paenibacillus sp. GM2]|uniref:hypothetical protein n=1 Tax=Paenibacillus sp. GM2 TaxID=1622070 RepID=UPI000A44613B|nr:hypothetical protein [Paenibacillus sp. GM2]